MEHGTIEPESAVRDNDAEAFIAHLVEHRHRIVAYISKLVVHPDDVEDVFQRTSLVLWSKRREFTTGASYFHWACGVAYNEVRNFLTVRRRDRHRFDAELITLLAEEAEREDDLTVARLAALRSCLSVLSETQRALLQRCYAGKATITDVAAGLGRSAAALHKQLARLRDKLRRCLDLRLSREGAGR